MLFRSRGVGLADGKTLWEHPGHPGLLTYANLAGTPCLVKVGLCLDAKTGKVLWELKSEQIFRAPKLGGEAVKATSDQKAEQTYKGPPIMVDDILISYVPHPKSDPPGAIGSLAGFKVSLTGIRKVWTQEERFHREIV